MTDDQAGIRVWLVERDYDDRNLVTLVYATPDGERTLRRELSAPALSRVDVTAARRAAPEDLRPAEPDDRDRYAAEATRMADRHDPDETV